MSLKLYFNDWGFPQSEENPVDKSNGNWLRKVKGMTSILDFAY